MKKIAISAALVFAGAAFGQAGNVGINTASPAATLDVVGQPATASKLDGIIAPRITGDQLHAKTYTASQNGALVYVTTAATAANQTGQTADVANVGLYYFDSPGNRWVYLSTYTTEPWLNAANSLPATSSSQNLYTPRNVSVGQNNAGPVFNVSNNTSTANNDVARLNLPETSSNISLKGNTATGSYNMMLQKGDIPFIFIANRQTANYSQNGVLIAPQTGNSVTYGLKITDQGKVAINTAIPSETLDVGGTARLRILPKSGSGMVFTTTSGGSTQPAPTSADQTFTGNKTVVADDRGVLGYVDGLPASGSIYAANGQLAGTRTVDYNGNNLSFVGNDFTTTTFNGGTTMMFTGMVYKYRELISGAYNTLQANDYSMFVGKETTANVTFNLPNNNVLTGRTICFSNVVQPDAAAQYTLTVTTGAQFPKNYVFNSGEGKCFQYAGQDRWLSF